MEGDIYGWGCYWFDGLLFIYAFFFFSFVYMYALYAGRMTWVLALLLFGVRLRPWSI
jgi:hypothetical protein